jgi:excisionase family DNA binding protein
VDLTGVTVDELLDLLADKVAAKVEARLAARQTAPDRLLDVREAADRLGVSTHTIYKRKEKGLIPFIKNGSKLLFKPSDLDAYVEQNRITSKKVTALANAASRRGT